MKEDHLFMTSENQGDDGAYLPHGGTDPHLTWWPLGTTNGGLTMDQATGVMVPYDPWVHGGRYIEDRFRWAYAELLHYPLKTFESVKSEMNESLLRVTF